MLWMVLNSTKATSCSNVLFSVFKLVVVVVVHPSTLSDTPAVLLLTNSLSPVVRDIKLLLVLAISVFPNPFTLRAIKTTTVRCLLLLLPIFAVCMLRVLRRTIGCTYRAKTQRACPSTPPPHPSPRCVCCVARPLSCSSSSCLCLLRVCCVAP